MTSEPHQGDKSLERLRALSVLIIDDSDLTREVLKAVVGSFGIPNIFEARDGIAGFDILARQPVDVIICDIIMLPMHGMKFIESLRAGAVPQGVSGPIPRDIPVIMITGKTLKELVEDPEQGWDAILSKPIQPDALLAELIRLAPGRPPETER